jgi:CubicO group peptidase (beta-lactamase class C family)
MTTGVAYSEDYADPEADVWTYVRAVDLLPRPDDYRGPTSIRAYLPTMKRGEATGEHFEYVTPVTEVLVWIIDKVTGQSFTEVLSDRIWSKLGMEHDALFIGRLCSCEADFTAFSQKVNQNPYR